MLTPSDLLVGEVRSSMNEVFSKKKYINHRFFEMKNTLVEIIKYVDKRLSSMIPVNLLATIEGFCLVS